MVAKEEANNPEVKALKRAKTSINIDQDKIENVGNTGKIDREKINSTYVGWKQIGNWEEKDELTQDDLLLDLSKETFMDNVLPEKFYGDWYHSLAIILIGGTLSFAFGKFKFSLAPVFIIILLSTLFYRTSIKKYRSSIRNLVQKEFTVQKIENDYESMEWLNMFLDKYWPVLEPSVSQMIVEQTNDILATNESIPNFVKAIWIDKFTLGVKPPRIEVAKTFNNTASDIVVMDWNVTFTPHDLSDMTAKQVRNYVNQKIIIKCKMFGLTIPIAISNVAFNVMTRIRFKLMTPFPHMETVNIQLLEVPDIDFIATLFGDSIFNWEIMAIPGLYSFIRQMAKKYMGPILLPPFSLQLNIPNLLSNTNLSMGVLEINIKNAKDLKTGSSIISASLDPYLSFELLNKKVGNTKTVRDSLNPVWNETLYILLNSFTDPLTITLMDKRARLKDKQFGRIELNLNSLHDTPVQKNLSANFLRNSKPIGNLTFDIKFFPTLQPKLLPNGIYEELPDLNTGIAKIVVEEIESVNDVLKKETYSVDVFLNAKNVIKSSTVTSDDIFKFNETYEAVISDRRKASYRFVVKDSKGNIVTSTIQSLNELIDRTEIDKKNIPLKGNKGTIKVTTYWRPVRLDFGNSSIAYTPPIGTLRVYISRANNLPNLETIGKIDPYTKVLVNGISKGRTDEKESTLDPIWNQSIYVAVTSPNQRVTLEVMDVETINKDRTVGQFNINIQDLFHKNKNDEYEQVIDTEPRVGKLITKKGPRGTLTYFVSFYPVKPVLTLEEILDSEKLDKKKLELKQKEEKKDKLTKEELESFEEEKLEIDEFDSLLSKKQKLDLNQLTSFKSGVLAISVLDGTVPRPNVYVQAFFDGNGHARFVSPKISTSIINNGWTGDVAIKELDYSVTTFRVTKNMNANKVEDCICEVTVPTAELIKNCYYKPSILNLSGEGSGKLLLQTQWFPLDTKALPQSDLITNEGELTIRVKNAENLVASDTNGFSDPYVKFYLNDEEDAFYKSKTKKKTLNPTWNETCTCIIKNRVNDIINIKIVDWDATSTNDDIGEAILKLSDVKPDGVTQLSIPIDAEGEDGGVLHLEFEFKPRYITTVCKRETNVGDVAAKGLTAGIKVGSTVVGTGIGTVGKIGKGIFGVTKLHRGKKESQD